ncbi:MAG: GlsB/YeaQ/YmgE family stress response membrane protein [Acidobacteria bacterium]|nr:GlsB/YeaQ/YmgE family stress response membrane protein [Acidobacteriota bacterium]
MTLESFLLLLLIAGICGAVGQAITGYNLGGILVTIAVGFIGALLGVWLAGVLGLPELFTLYIGGQRFPIVWSIIGSVLFVAIVGAFSNRRHVIYR